MTVMQVHFESKDPLIAEYYRNTFADEFVKTAQFWPKLTEMEREGIMAAWRLEMFHEARLQEHYDYTTDEVGRRVLIYEVYARDGLKIDTNIPKLMIPEVRVTQVS